VVAAVVDPLAADEGAEVAAVPVLALVPVAVEAVVPAVVAG
jgi:hypothetical protein